MRKEFNFCARVFLTDAQSGPAWERLRYALCRIPLALTHPAG
jgi:hypothetical protein